MDATGLVRLDDVRAAEKILDEAIAKRDLLREPDNWPGAYETLNRKGRKVIQLESLNLELAEAADAAVQRARRRVIAVRRAWLGLDDGGRAGDGKEL
ncbi:MAG: hypothetical protein K2Q25_08005 [Mycobacteriaceae bacterium]|nr:hypothetical protein [Mycobacteriaceae bacterium]